MSYRLEFRIYLVGGAKPPLAEPNAAFGVLRNHSPSYMVATTFNGLREGDHPGRQQPAETIQSFP
jgi:hypothetical protein